LGVKGGGHGRGERLARENSKPQRSGFDLSGHQLPETLAAIPILISELL
jgi:hypothetical protein